MIEKEDFQLRFKVLKVMAENCILVEKGNLMKKKRNNVLHMFMLPLSSKGKRELTIKVQTKLYQI